MLHFSAQLLDAASKVLPLVVTVSGRVGSDTPINCEYSGLRGVIVEQTVLGLNYHGNSEKLKKKKKLLCILRKSISFFFVPRRSSTF